jgi:hypothetical protein
MIRLINNGSRIFEDGSPPIFRQVLTVCLLLLGALGSAAHAQSATEYQVKAAFLFNFAKFAEWPGDVYFKPDAPLQICILGQDPFGHDLDQLVAGKTVNGHRIEVDHPEGIAPARTCEILFISATGRPQIQQILDGLKGANVLTVGDTPGFAQMGGVINFVLDDNRVRFEINLKAASNAHLKISSRLLTVAKLVLPAGEN